MTDTDDTTSQHLYVIKWQLTGETEITASTKEEARAQFDKLRVGAYAEDDYVSLEVLGEPEYKVEDC